MMDTTKKSLQVAAIENGTVIDHIPTDKVFTIASLLQLDRCNDQVTIGNNLDSGRMGSKGIIKIANRFFSDAEISRLAAVCPNIRLCIIRDYEVVEKRIASLPDEFVGIVRCANPVCITNNEPMKTVFYVTDKEQGVVKCRYCGKEQNIEHIKLV
ncbi:MAG: aspartate carbamoyltransferase regulatory subunit [Bacteroidaceae bacterium]|nr:aspartate carbamoyltransferase regulatory subunit [Bacteroidaceae bacterium]MDO4994778.1 aspartate carbamoyltransferase regulatory subunit [Bacteroidales bacterium]